MEAIYRSQVNILAFALLAFVFVIAFKKLEKKDALNRAFLFTVVGVLVGLFFESLSVFLNGNTSAFAIFLNNLSSSVIFIAPPVLSVYFFIFIFYLVLPTKKITKGLWVLFLIPIIINAVIGAISPFTGLYFQISELGVYSRGPLFILSASIVYLFMVAGIVLILFNYKRLLKNDFYLFLGIGILPILGGIAQSMMYGVLAMWSSAAVAMIIGYLFLQDRMIRLDSLTGAWNRESFYLTYTRRIHLNPDKPFGAIYFDIDNLKMINDHYGHLEGDNAIIQVIDIVKSMLPFGTIICRLGGDEFIALYDWKNNDEMNIMLKSIKDYFTVLGKSETQLYELECSFGAALFTKEFASIDAFLSKLDTLMYEEKQRKKFNYR